MDQRITERKNYLAWVFSHIATLWRKKIWRQKFLASIERGLKIYEKVQKIQRNPNRWNSLIIRFSKYSRVWLHREAFGARKLWGLLRPGIRRSGQLSAKTQVWPRGRASLRPIDPQLQFFGRGVWWRVAAPKRIFHGACLHGVRVMRSLQTD